MGKEQIYLCIRECDVEISATGVHNHFFAGEFVVGSAPNKSCFIVVTSEQYKQLSKIMKDIDKERRYREKQYLKIKESHPKPNWKVEQRIDGSVQEERSMKRRFNTIVSQIAKREIEVLFDWKTQPKISW